MEKTESQSFLCYTLDNDIYDPSQKNTLIGE